jgi:hypothetical protein
MVYFMCVKSPGVFMDYYNCLQVASHPVLSIPCRHVRYLPASHHRGMRHRFIEKLVEIKVG